MSSSKQSSVWAFDLGLGSIGEAVRVGTEFKHVASLLIPAEFAETKIAAGRRRMMRTRQAHKAREDWLDEVWREAGLEPLQKRRPYQDPVSQKWIPEKCQKADPKLEREFAAKGDTLCYTSCLLRIKLLRGEKLETWQIYKALHSAMQKRGYDKDIPWKKAEARRAGKTLEQLKKEESKADEELAKKDPAYQAALGAWKVFKKEMPESFHFPCYYDAWKMGLWHPSEPEQLKAQIDHTAESTRNVRFDREDIAREIKNLAVAAGKQIKALQGKENYLLYGPAGQPYASHDPTLRKEHGLHLGSEDDWKGVLGQKIPRFDNRILNGCALIPRFHVCKAEDELARDVTYLLKLKNILVERCGLQQKLSVDDINDLYTSSKPSNLNFTCNQWKKWCKDNAYLPLPGHEEIAAPKVTGRSRFSRPALRLVKELVLSGLNPAAFYEEKRLELASNTDPKKGLIPGDLKFLADLGNQTWAHFYLPEQKLDAIEAQNTKEGVLDKEAAIRAVIGSINDPIVRHRLTTFNQRLHLLEKTHGNPDEVVLEFVREDFMGKKAKDQLKNFQEEREKARKRSKEEASLVSDSKSAPLKLELLRQQEGICLYTGQGLIPAELDAYEIEHIVPRSQGGPDAMMNYVLTTIEANEAKGDQTPYQWLKSSKGWDAYKDRVEKAHINNKKRQLLLRDDATELVERYTGLAETAWISKLAQKIVSLRYDWRNGIDKEGNKHITVVSGGLTGRIRRKYRLNHVLNPDAKAEEEAEKKNRDDDRHHALDAMVISFIPGWMRDKSKQYFFRFPEEVQKNPRGFFLEQINQVYPHNLALLKARMAQTIYGRRGKGLDSRIVLRASLFDFAYKKSVFDLDYLRGQTKKIRDQNIRQAVLNFLEKNSQEADWKSFCSELRQPSRNGKKGSLIKKLWMNVGNPDSYRDLSKDGSGSFFQAEKSHKGQIVYLELKKGKDGKVAKIPRVEPVYVFDSPGQVGARLKEKFGGGIQIYGFFQSGCTIEIVQDLIHSSTVTLKKGKYRLNTIQTDSTQAKVTANNGKVSLAIGLKKFIEAGFRRVSD